MTIETDGLPDRFRIRRLRDLLEPLAGCVYFAPETHEAFQALGFGPPNPGFGNVVAPNGVAYFVSRGGCMGQVSGEVVTAAFGVFSPAVVVPAVEAGWATADRSAILDARCSGTSAFLERVIEPNDGRSMERIGRLTELLLAGADGAALAGRPLYAGLRSLGMPGHPMGDLWRAADLVREHRGDCHVVAWTGAGLSAPEIMLLTELWWGMPPRSYALTRGWSTEQFDEAEATLVAKGLVTASSHDEDGLTEDGRALRRSIEGATDELERGVMAGIGADLDELIELLEPVAAAIVANEGYPNGAFQTASDC